MRKLITLVLIALTINSFGQLSTINFEEELNQLNNGVPLPSEQKLLLVGNIPEVVNLVEVGIFTAKGKEGRDALYVNRWKRPLDNNGTQFRLSVNYRLIAGKTYDFVLRYYEKLDAEQTKQLYQYLLKNLDNYVDQSFEVGKKKVLFSKKTKRMMDDLNDVVRIGLSNYRTTNPSTFNGFSDIIAGQLDKIDGAELKDADRIVNEADKDKAMRAYRKKMINDLKQMLRTEAQFVLNDEWNTLTQEHQIEEVETEKRNGYFSLNIGYGAVYLDGKVDNLSYDAAPYVGLAFPLSTSTIAPKFFRNASITVGVFTRNFKDEMDNKITGPIIKRPVYLGLDYKLFQFIRFNAGAAFLEEVGEDNGQINGIEKRVFVQPFVGLSAKVNISVGLDK
jgi:hypothetical protein